MLTPAFQQGCQEALEHLAAGASLADVLGIIVRAAEQTSEAVCSVLSSRDGLRISSSDLSLTDLSSVENALTRGVVPLEDSDFFAAWREPIVGIKGRVLGLFCLFKKDKSNFDESDIAFCQVCAHLSGLAIERRRDEVRLKDREAELSALAEAIIDGVITIDAKGKIEAFNPAAENMFGYRAEEIIGRNVKLLMTDEHASAHDGYLQRYQETGHRKIIGIGREVMGKRKDGTSFPLDLGVSELIVGGVRKFTGILRDITERKRAEEALRESERRLTALMSNLPGMAYRAENSPGWTLSFASPGCRALTGYEPDELTGDDAVSYEDLIHSEDRAGVREMINAAIARDEAFELQYRIKAKDGKEKHVWEKGRLIKGAGFLEGFIADETERVDLEAQLRQSQKLEAVGTLAAGVAHDFNNLLMGIKGCTSIALKKLPRDSPARTFLDEANNAAERGAQLTRQLLAFSRRRRAERRPMNINDVVRQTDVMLRRLIGESIDFVVDLSETAGEIDGDPAQLEQALINLVVNARDAVEQRGTITVNTGFEVQGGQRYVMLQVKDTGVGMDEETQSRIFEPFYTTKGPDRGTGLGLSSVYGITEEHNGRVEVKSAPGEGTTLRLLIPERQQTASLPKTPDAPRGAGESILVVEDDRLVLQAVTHALDEAGYVVHQVDCIEKAKDAVSSAPPDLVLADMVLPDGGGMELWEYLKAHQPSVLFMLMSGYPGEKPEVPFIAKPFAERDITRKIREVLDAARER